MATECTLTDPSFLQHLQGSTREARHLCAECEGWRRGEECWTAARGPSYCLQ